MNVGENVSIFRLTLPENSKLAGKSIKEIALPKKSLIVAVEREDKFIIPTEEVVLEPNDRLTVLARKDVVDRVTNLLTSRS